MRKINPQKIKEDIKKMHGEDADIDLTTYVKTNKKARLICPIHGEFWAAVSSVRAGHWCPQCAIERNAKKATISPDIRAQQVYALYGDSFILDKSTCTVTMNKSRFICATHGEVWARLDNVLNGEGCVYCGRIKTANCHRKDVNEFEKEYKRIHGDSFDFDRSTFIDMKHHAKFICPFHGEFWKSPQKVQDGQGCPECSFERISKLNAIPIEENVCRIDKIFKGRISLIPEPNLKTMSKATFICKEHGEFKAIINDMLHGGDCPVCRTSKLEKPIHDLLVKKHCYFDFNKCLKGCKMKDSKKELRPDFVFKNYPLVFELDGYQHYIPVLGYENFKKIQERDKFKNKYLKDNGYILIRTVYDDKAHLVSGKYITLSKLIELINKGISDTGEVNLNVFIPYDFNANINFNI